MKHETRSRDGFPMLTLGASLLSHPRLYSHPYPGSDLLCCPGEVQDLFSLVLQPWKDRDSFPTLMTPGPGLRPGTGGEG